MAHQVALSKTRLLAFRRCPRKLWLDQYSPELEEVSDEAQARFETGRIAGEYARRIYGLNGAREVSHERGLRAAVRTTSVLIEAGGSEPIFEATFDHGGLTIQVDILDCAAGGTRIVEVTSSPGVEAHHLHDCAIQAWTLAALGHRARQVTVAHINSEFVYRGDGSYEGLFTETDVTEEVERELDAIPELVAGARSILERLDEPDIAVGKHCTSPHACPFLGHCAPPQAEYPVTILGGREDKLFEWLHAGYRDLRDVPEELLLDDTQRRMQWQTRTGQPYVGDELREFVAALGYPRHCLGFETISFAAPIWEDTGPYEALPFQWSCHTDGGSLDESSGGLAHAGFVDLSGGPPMRECAETLIDALGGRGPIVVYSPREQAVIDGLISRYTDLEAPLAAIRDRVLVLLPVLKRHYYDPAMRGSWSIETVAPTVAADLSCETLGDARDSHTARSAYLEAIKPETSAERRRSLRKDLLARCRYGSLALAGILKFFGKPA